MKCKPQANKKIAKKAKKRHNLQGLMMGCVAADLQSRKQVKEAAN